MLLSFLAMRTELPPDQIAHWAAERAMECLVRLDLLHALQSFYGLHSIYHLLTTDPE